VIFRIINIAWLALALVWFAGALGNKRTARNEPFAGRMLHVALTVVALLLLFGPVPAWREVPLLRGAMLWIFGPAGMSRQVPLLRGGVGLAMTLTGLAFTIWARVSLGRNWSGTVEVKQNHELVRRGPYRIVRHPIYSGALFAMLGTAIAFGEWRGYPGFAIALFTWKIKSLTEERFMSEQFGDAYVRYQAEVKALIPGIL
jgi:protein-S-isoprenylcysteine O-methyltransferase Ste14